MATSSVPESLWKEAFGEDKRPTLYLSTKIQKNDLAALTSPKEFMKDLESLSQIQLYALAENGQLALKTAQDEYLHIESLIRRLEQKDSPTNPQILLDPDRFEEEKEAALYGYKRIPRGIPYTRTKDGIEFYGFQEPFSQGGFVPTDAQYKRMKAHAKNPNNIDGWTPIERGGRKLIPRMPRSPPPRQRGFTGTLTRPSRQRRFIDQTLSDTDATATFSDSDAFTATPSKRATRFLGLKIPLSRDPSETPTSHRNSPAAPSRHPELAMKNLTPTSISKLATSNNGLSTHFTPARYQTTSPTQSSSTTKRRRINNKPHFNQTTNPRASPSPNNYEPDSEKKWTDISLLSAINTDHSFLHPDPATALSWKTAILNAPNPVRSYAMKRKWAWWRKGGMDKRPRRGLEEGEGGIVDGEGEVKKEDVKQATFKKEEEADVENLYIHNHDGEAAAAAAPPPPLPPTKKPPAVAVTSEGNETKQQQSIAMKQQRNRQFTFKLDHPPLPPTAPAPPAPPPSSSLSVWTADLEDTRKGRGRGGREAAAAAVHEIVNIPPNPKPPSALSSLTREFHALPPPI